jgi:hypothetical protein
LKPRDFCRELGYDKALLVTYDFNALFFERVVLPDLWVGGSTDVQVIADLGQVSQALPRWIGQVRQLGQRYQLTCANVRGAFHPKIIVRAGSAGAAVWIGSGNLTDGGWGCNLEVGTAWCVGQALADRGNWLRSLLTAISSWLPEAADASSVYQKVIDAPWLNIDGDAPAPPILISEPRRSIGQQLVERWQGRRFDRAMIVTGSSDDRGAVLKWLHDQFGVSQATILLDPSMVSFDPARLAGLPMQIALVRPKEARTVHAKFYWLEGPDGCASVMGSANCSAAAWLISPENGGNIEAIAVYDHPSKVDFGKVLARIDPSETEPANLVYSAEPEENNQQSGRPYPVAEVSWERLKSQVIVVFATSLPNGAAVAVEVSGERAVCQSRKNSHVWSAIMAADPFRGRGTVFGDVRITLADDQELSPQQVWINDLAELRTSARGRGIGEHIKNLGRWHPTSEHQKIVAELQRIGTALLTDNSLFPDPLFRNPKAASETSTDDAPTDAPPVDPEHLIRSIDIHGEATQHAHSAHGLNGVTLTGVLRALFDFGDEELETGAIEEPGDPGGSDPPPGPRPPGKPPTPPPPPPLPPERARTKLRKDMDEFVRKLAEKEFATKCTVTQLVQAVAYPLAVITNGTRGGWIDGTSGQDWTTRVFDTSFCAQYSVGTVGLLDAVRQRCDASGELQAFRTIVGDGTLWAAMLASVSRTAWTGANSGIKKAFALRRVLLSQELLASAEAGRMSSLITNIERQSGRSLVLNLARDATAILTELEQYLAVHWDDLIKRQVSCKLAHLPGNALFHPKGGWVFVLEPTGNIDETKLRVYRQNRAGEARVQSGFYLNVTKSADGDARLSNWLKRLSCLGEN